MVAKEILEEWRDIDGYVGFYQVSNLGRVKSLSRFRSNHKNGTGYVTKAKILSSCIDKHTGYLGLHLCKNNKPYMYTVHELVCNAFIGPKPSPKHEVCHRDGSRLNNYKGNLRWGTHKENGEDAVKHGASPKGEKHGMVKLAEDNVRQIRELRLDGYLAKDIADMFGVSGATIGDIIHKRTWAWLA